MALQFGRGPVRRDNRTLLFGAYLTPQVPAPPPAFSALDRVFANLANNNVGQLFPLDGNDAYGDCTIAALAHATTIFQARVGVTNIMPSQDVIDLYMRLANNQPLAGLVELDVLNYWRQNMVDGDEIYAYAGLNLQNHVHVKQAIQIFGGVYLGFRVQQACMDDFYARRAWTPGPPIQNAQGQDEGHAVYAVAYDDQTLTVLTWGSTQTATWAWWDAMVDEAYAILPSDAQNGAYEPGFDMAQLQQDLNAITN